MMKMSCPAKAILLSLLLCASAPPQTATSTQTPPPATPKQASAPKSAPNPTSAPEKAPIKSTAADRTSLEVTIYNRDLGLIKEQRAVKAEAGQGELQFIGVASRINPVTVHIKPLAGAGDFSVLEQNYEYDLISHAKLMDKYVGKQIKIIDANEFQDRKDVVEATLLSYSNGEVYKIGGEIYLGHPGIKVLPELPGNLIARPTLSWIYRSKTAREYPIEVSYMTGGMDWNADYILTVSEGKGGAGLSGWVTVNNQSGAEFRDAKLKLVAGEVNRAPEPYLRGYGSGYGAKYAAMLAAPPEFSQSEVFEYHMYDLERKTTLKDNQTKQISLLEAQGVNIVKEYATSPAGGGYNRHSGSGGEAKQPVTAYLTFKNTKENKLGMPIPAGTVRIYTADAQNRQQFIGEDRVNHTPKDEEIRLKAGEAFDIVAERTQVDFKQKTSRMTETEWKVALRNRKNEDITVKVVESAYGQWEIIESSHKYVKESATAFRFDVAVGAGKEVVVKYKIRVGN